MVSPVFEGTEFCMYFLNEEDLTKKYILLESNLNTG